MSICVLCVTVTCLCVSCVHRGDLCRFCCVNGMCMLIPLSLFLSHTLSISLHLSLCVCLSVWVFSTWCSLSPCLFLCILSLVPFHHSFKSYLLSTCPSISLCLSLHPSLVIYSQEYLACFITRTLMRARTHTVVYTYLTRLQLSLSVFLSVYISFCCSISLELSPPLTHAH